MDRNATDREGYHPFLSEDDEEYGSFEVYWHEEGGHGVPEGETYETGWYWVAGFPGCTPDSETPNGPFATSRAAYDDACDQSWSQ